MKLIGRASLARVHSLNRLSMSSSVISAKGLAAPGAACFFARTSNTLASSSPAFFTRRRTSPSELFASKITTSTTRPATMLMWSDSRSPSWNWFGNSFSPMSFASPPIAATLPAVSEASEVVSRFCAWPLDAISCPFLSTRKTTLAFASRVSRSQIPAISRNSSSYITKPEFMRARLALGEDPNHRRIPGNRQSSNPAARARSPHLDDLLVGRGRERGIREGGVDRYRTAVARPGVAVRTHHDDEPVRRPGGGAVADDPVRPGVRARHLRRPADVPLVALREPPPRRERLAVASRPGEHLRHRGRPTVVEDHEARQRLGGALRAPEVVRR